MKKIQKLTKYLIQKILMTNIRKGKLSKNYSVAHNRIPPNYCSFAHYFGLSNTFAQ